MKIESQIQTVKRFEHLELLANQIVEGFISGMHKSPFHGFSSEFAEHKLYNSGESTKNIDWKLFAKTDRLYTKKFDEDTNMRCHIIIDNSASMQYPELQEKFFDTKIGFAILASAVLMNLLKKQRDAVGLSIFSNSYEYYAPEKGSDRHNRMILNALENILKQPKNNNDTNAIIYLHQIAEKIKRRSMVLLFTDMFQAGNEEELFAALQHLKHNKNKVVLFHVYDSKTELNFDFDASPRKFIDLETKDEVAVFSDNIKEEYQKRVNLYFKKLTLVCSNYKINYVPVSISEGFEKILTTYLVEKQNFG